MVGFWLGVGGVYRVLLVAFGRDIFADTIILIGVLAVAVRYTFLLSSTYGLIQVLGFPFLFFLLLLVFLVWCMI